MAAQRNKATIYEYNRAAAAQANIKEWTEFYFLFFNTCFTKSAKIKCDTNACMPSERSSAE